MKHAVLIVVMLASMKGACESTSSNPSPSPCPTPLTASPTPAPYVERHTWKKKADSKPWVASWDFVCPSTGRIDDANIDLDDDGSYRLWSRGGGWGEYDSLENAKRAGERTVKLRGFECPE